jgi:hypothetical protein
MSLKTIVVMVARKEGVLNFDKQFDLNIYFIPIDGQKSLIKTESIDYLPKTFKLDLPVPIDPRTVKTDEVLFHLQVELVDAGQCLQ